MPLKDFQAILVCVLAGTKSEGFYLKRIKRHQGVWLIVKCVTSNDFSKKNKVNSEPLYNNAVFIDVCLDVTVNGKKCL